MESHIVKILDTEFININVKRFVVEKPKNYKFIPGQATEISINKSGWGNELRPFTFTSLNEWKHLEFTIKIYSDHKGVTNELGKTNKGEELILHDIFGAIQYNGPGVFIAGGAGVTPFIAIIRSLQKEKKLQHNSLIFSNRTSDDVFMDKEFSDLLGNNFIKVFTHENVIGFLDHRIDRNMLITFVHDFDQHFYVCGPDDFVKNINSLLLDLGAKPSAVVFEK